MDLALELGMTADGLSRSMTEAEFGEWHSYAQRRMLPWRRMELHLAQIALVIAKTMGGVKNAELDDFLFDPPPLDADLDDDGDEVPDIADLAGFFGATIVMKG